MTTDSAITAGLPGQSAAHPPVTLLPGVPPAAPGTGRTGPKIPS